MNVDCKLSNVLENEIIRSFVLFYPPPFFCRSLSPTPYPTFKHPFIFVRIYFSLIFFSNPHKKIEKKKKVFGLEKCVVTFILAVPVFFCFVVKQNLVLGSIKN
ncbi:unnamed protein product [Citrullus colocynthis]|uniref:Transmembrane protein n=1 Tax=Citrullus colocynthis TaxID=252529 RepID=A0ABP0YV74_9ROSI